MAASQFIQLSHSVEQIARSHSTRPEEDSPLRRQLWELVELAMKIQQRIHEKSPYGE